MERRGWSDTQRKRIEDATDVVLALCPKQWEETSPLKKTIKEIAMDTDLKAFVYKQQIGVGYKSDLSPARMA